MKKGAIFDMDGVLFDTERLYQKTWNLVAVQMGQKISSTFQNDIGGTNGEAMRTVIRKHYPAVDPDTFISACLDQLQEIEKTYVPEKPGLRPFLEYLQANNVKMAVASSSPIYMIENNLQVAGIESYFAAVVSGSQVARGKPEPDIFLYAAEQLGLAPEECYVFEDSFNGIRAGVAAGCTTIMIPDLFEPTEEIRQLAAGVYTDFGEVKCILSRSNPHLPNGL